jgi:endogenous inhibitor of DNA gyrase (YacG/DUF329 family)
VRSAPCPTCRRPTTWEDNSYRPFCSERCRVVDLGAWASGKYRIAGDPIVDEITPALEDEPD